MTVYTVGAGKTTVIIGLTIANITAGSITVNATIENNDGDNISIGKNLPIPTGSRLDILAGKIVMEASDVLKVQSNTANATSIALSIMEIS